MNRGAGIDQAHRRDHVAFTIATSTGAIAVTVFVAALRLVSWG